MRKQINKGLYIMDKAYQYYRYLLPFTKANRVGGEISSDRIVSVFSDPRGGSTWLSDIFCQLPDSMLIWEPMFLHPPYPEMKDVNFCFHQYIPEEAEWPEAEEYFRKLYNMEIGSRSSFRLYYLNKTLKNITATKHFVYKDCCCNMLLPWLTARLDVNPVYVIRHPCAVVASQLKYKHWDYILKDVKAHFPEPGSRFQEIYHRYQDIIDTITKPEERMAAEWALHNSVPIKHPLNDIRWVTVSYEKLYKEPETEISRVFGRLNMEIPGKILSDIRKPSITALEGSKSIIQSGQQLESWRKSLTPAQVKNILHIVKEFDMDFYDESPEPDYTRIFAAPALVV